MSAFRPAFSFRAVLLLALSVLIAPTASAGIVVSVLPGSQLSVMPGDLATVDLTISGLGVGTSPSLGVYDLNLTFDPPILPFVSGDWGTGLDLFGLGDVRSAAPSAGLVNLFELSLDSAADLNAFQPSTFLLASLQFQGVSTGTSNIALAINALGDANGAPLSANI